MDFTKKRNAFIQKNLKRGYPQKKGNLTDAILRPLELGVRGLPQKKGNPKSWVSLIHRARRIFALRKLGELNTGS